MQSFDSQKVITEIKKLFPGKTEIHLHEPCFVGAEKSYLVDCVDSTFVSSVGKYVTDFEKKIAEFTGVRFAIATTNGTSALHLALVAAGVGPEDEVLTQDLTFVATANSIAYTGAKPIFIDSDPVTMGMCAATLEKFLRENTKASNEGFSYNVHTGRQIKACVPMHTLGLPLQIEEILNVCQKYKITLIEDAAEALGSYLNGKHVGSHGEMSTLSFNGNKIITCGGGGMVITNNEVLAKKLKHLSTTAKVAHPWEFFHDEVGYNYRLPNINAALGCAQMEQIPRFLESKKKLSAEYARLFSELGVEFIVDRAGTESNRWLNAIRLKSAQERDDFIALCQSQKIFARPMWRLMTELPMFSECQRSTLDNAKDLAKRVVCLPSSVRL
jgi:perosamine synthetase